jgi:hypothetical protein
MMAGPIISYHGRQPRGGGAGIITALDADGDAAGLVAHLPKHSPGGMAWGYPGSGAADCARSLLVAALGKAAQCPACTDGSCNWCDLGYLHLPYQRFKDDLVARLPDDWTMGRACILGWLLRADPGVLEWLIELSAGRHLL